MVALLVTAAELHARADLGVVDAAETVLAPELLAHRARAAPGRDAAGAHAQAG